MSWIDWELKAEFRTKKMRRQQRDNRKQMNLLCLCCASLIGLCRASGLSNNRSRGPFARFPRLSFFPHSFLPSSSDASRLLITSLVWSTQWETKVELQLQNSPPPFLSPSSASCSCLSERSCRAVPCRAGHTDSRQAPVPPRHALMDLIVPTAASGAGALQVFLLSSSNEA